jgi:hypothetical protein
VTSHLDIARKELMAQRRLVSQEIGQLTRQLKKIDQALEHLAPVNHRVAKAERVTPSREEGARRYDVVYAYLKDQGATPFSAPDLVEETGEPAELLYAYGSILKTVHNRGQIEVLTPGVRGRKHTVYRNKVRELRDQKVKEA